jgi:hypothetical protein
MRWAIPYPLGTFIAKNKDAWSKISVNGVDNGLANSAHDTSAGAASHIASVDHASSDDRAPGSFLESVAHQLGVPNGSLRYDNARRRLSSVSIARLRRVRAGIDEFRSRPS